MLMKENECKPANVVLFAAVDARNCCPLTRVKDVGNIISEQLKLGTGIDFVPTNMRFCSDDNQMLRDLTNTPIKDRKLELFATPQTEAVVPLPDEQRFKRELQSAVLLAQQATHDKYEKKLQELADRLEVETKARQLHEEAMRADLQRLEVETKARQLHEEAMRADLQRMEQDLKMERKARRRLEWAVIALGGALTCLVFRRC